VNIDVNANDSFENSDHTITAIDGSPIAANGMVAVSHGSVTLLDDGTLTFAPAQNYSGSTAFTYTVTSGGVTETATVDVTVAAANAPPTITSDGGGDTATKTVPENTTAVTTVTATDADNGPQPISYAIVGGADQSKFQIDSTSGALSFIAAPDYETPQGSTNGGEGYVVQVAASDGAASDTQTITVTVTNVNEAPTAHPDAVSATEAGGVNNQTAGVNPTGNVLSNDTDPDAGDTLAVQGVAAGTATGPLASGTGQNIGGAYGTIHVNADGSATYTVDNSNASVQALRTPTQTLTDTFSYTVKDSGGLTSTTQVTVTIHGQNDNPVAAADTASATEAGGVNNQTAGVNPTGNVLSNDTDPDAPGGFASAPANGETQTVTGVAFGTTPSGSGVGTSINGTYGALVLNADGTYTYTVDNTKPSVEALNTGDHPTDTFTYTMQDAAGASSNATLTVTVNGADDAPVAVNDGSSTSPITVTSGAQSSVNLLANDTDVDTPHGNLTAAVNSQPSHGTVVVNSNGTFTYTASSGYVGQDTFTYHASDGTYASNSATVTVNIPPNIAYINNASTSSTEDGTMANPYKSIADFNAANDASHNYQTVYIEKGSGSYVVPSTGITLLANEVLEGQGVDPTYV
ncbi:Ig-like domain-containing protein, partial [Jatrophihabitans endophyticus]|uniref:Ig-like domain-containing protein n=1 Tax=Jatrophihabitans endophyticus TaxID=1206085 RepID=UPI001A0EA495